MSLGEVLVVENEGIICADIKLRLRAMGFSASSASSGEVAIKLAEQRNPDFSIVDIHLGGTLGRVLDGIETAKILKQRFSVSALFLTAHADRLTDALTKELDPLGLLLKPYREEDFKIAVELAETTVRTQRAERLAIKMKNFEELRFHG